VIKLAGGVVIGSCALAALTLLGVGHLVNTLGAALEFDYDPFTTLL
jgi:hypothetical protein